MRPLRPYLRRLALLSVHVLAGLSLDADAPFPAHNWLAQAGSKTTYANSPATKVVILTEEGHIKRSAPLPVAPAPPDDSYTLAFVDAIIRHGTRSPDLERVEKWRRLVVSVNKKSQGEDDLSLSSRMEAVASGKLASHLLPEGYTELHGFGREWGGLVVTESAESSAVIVNWRFRTSSSPRCVASARAFMRGVAEVVNNSAAQHSGGESASEGDVAEVLAAQHSGGESASEGDVVSDEEILGNSETNAAGEGDGKVAGAGADEKGENANNKAAKVKDRQSSIIFSRKTTPLLVNDRRMRFFSEKREKDHKRFVREFLASDPDVATAVERSGVSSADSLQKLWELAVAEGSLLKGVQGLTTSSLQGSSSGGKNLNLSSGSSKVSGVNADGEVPGSSASFPSAATGDPSSSLSESLSFFNGLFGRDPLIAGAMERAADVKHIYKNGYGNHPFSFATYAPRFLRDWIARLDGLEDDPSISEEGPFLRFSFGHAETLMPILSWLGFFKREWRASWICPFAANFNVVVWRRKRSPRRRGPDPREGRRGGGDGGGDGGDGGEGGKREDGSGAGSGETGRTAGEGERHPGVNNILQLFLNGRELDWTKGNWAHGKLGEMVGGALATTSSAAEDEVAGRFVPQERHSVPAFVDFLRKKLREAEALIISESANRAEDGGDVKASGGEEPMEL